MFSTIALALAAALTRWDDDMCWEADGLEPEEPMIEANDDGTFTLSDGGDDGIYALVCSAHTIDA